MLTMKHTPQSIGEIARAARRGLGVTQKALALTSGTGLRFIIDLEKGKPTCQIGKALVVLHTLGVKMDFTPPPAVSNGPKVPSKDRASGRVVR